VFEVDGDIVAYAECSYEVTGSDNWINPRYFEKRDMRPLFVDELAVHPEMHGRGVGSTSVAVNLGCILAREERNSVVLVDLDMALGDADVCMLMRSLVKEAARATRPRRAQPPPGARPS
jgi:GNAT superfamily N-acetyltransferase